jgi:hypothetical protein
VVHPRSLTTATRYKLGASLLIGVPAVVLLVFALAEMLGGDRSGAQHLPESAALLALLGLGWRYPRVAGWLLVGVGSLLLVAWVGLIVLDEAREIETAELPLWVGTALVLFGAPLVAGFLLLKAAR